MSWSTKQLADLTGVTLRSIRHWHDVGLLPEPDRLSNGYKQYTAHHLVLALRIARLTGLGFALGDVARMLASEEDGRDALYELQTELTARIAGLERIRSEVDELIRLGISPDLSPFALLAMDALGEDPVSRNVAIVLAHLTPEEDTIGFVETLKDAAVEFEPINAAIWALSDAADPADITRLASLAADTIREFYGREGAAVDSFERQTDAADADTITAVATESMNGAQRRVMQLILDGLRGSPS